jgi:hypothetical protein
VSIKSASKLFSTVHAWKLLLLLLLAIPAAQLAVGLVCDGLGPSALILTDLNPKTLPISFESDANDKDVKYKSRSVYKPATVTTGGAKKDVRLMMLAKKDGAALRAVMEQQIRASDMDYRIRLAFDPNQTNGLIDGTSLGFFDFILLEPGQGVSPLRRLEAVYNAGLGGYTVRATDGNVPLGIEVDVRDEEVVLRMRLVGGTLFMEAGRPTGSFVTNINTTELHSETIGGGGPVTHTFAWGVSGLGKAARMYFNLLTLWGDLPDIGAAETPIAEQLMCAVLIAGNTQFPADVASATDNMEDIRALLAQVVTDLTAAVDGDLLNAPAQGKLALKSAQKALKLAQKAKASGDKMLAAGKTNPKALGNKARGIALRAVLSLVQVGGFRSNSPNKVLKTATFF